MNILGKKKTTTLLAVCHVANYLKYEPPDFPDELTAIIYYLFHQREVSLSPQGLCSLQATKKTKTGSRSINLSVKIPQVINRITKNDNVISESGRRREATQCNKLQSFVIEN